MRTFFGVVLLLAVVVGAYALAWRNYKECQTEFSKIYCFRELVR